MQYTTIEQSRRLLELGLDPSTADMYWPNAPITVPCVNDTKPKGEFIPAWSLDALLKVIPCPYQMTRGRDGAVQFMLINVLRHDTFNTELEAVYTMVVWLLEKDLLDPIKLKNYDTKRAD